jgi:hypothetical protein
MRSALVLVFVIACGGGDDSSKSGAAQLSGDACAAHIDQASCVADSPCQWYALGRPCPGDGSYCQSGVCQDPNAGGGSGSGGAGAACACPDGGVCFEQVGGTVQQGSAGEEIQCAVPGAGSGDACARIEGQGTCRPSETVSGLCVCDNGIR